MTDQELQNLIASNAKSIEALANNMTQMSDEVRTTQRQLRDIIYRVSDNTADIREIILENQRILRYLEQRNN